jgi:hypothetical protein
MKRAMLIVVVATVCGSAAWAAQRGILSVQTAPPVIVKTDPQSGDTKVDPAMKEIRVT